MAEEPLLDKVQDLSDLELAALLCLTSQEHCIIDTEPDVLDELVAELQLVRTTEIQMYILFAKMLRSPPMCLVSATVWWIALNTPAWTISPILSC